MYSYILGKIISINKKSITVENNYFGYVINVGNPNVFEENKIKKIYLYKHCTINNKSRFIEELYGFKLYDEKQFFMNCIAITGIGPKTAINFLQNDINIIKKLIISKDTEGLEKLPGISKKYAHYLIDYLFNIYSKDKIETYDNISDVINILKSLGYSQDDINFAITKLNQNNCLNNDQETSDVVSNAIKFISVKNESENIKA